MNIQYGSGFYSTENDGIRKFRWMQNKAQLSLPEQTKFIIFEYGLPSGTSTLLIKGEKEIFIPLTEGWHKLVISIDSLDSRNIIFNCKNKIEIPYETRNLSLMIGDIQIYDDIPLRFNINDLNLEIKKYIKNLKLSQKESTYIEIHSKRYKISLEFLEKNNFYPGNCFEMGGGGFFTHMLNKVYPISNFFTSNNDLRSRLPFPNSSMDSVISMEVFEHLTDPIGYREIHLDGIFKMLMEAHRILKDDGWFFLTTPNATSYSALNKIIQHVHPYEFSIHYREYTPNEMRHILSVFFKNIYLETFDVFHNYSQSILCESIDNIERGENIFILCQKKKLSYTINEAQIKMYASLLPNLDDYPELKESFINKKYQ